MLLRIFQNKTFKFFSLFIISFLVLYILGNILQEYICGGIANVGNLFITLFGESDRFKLFPDKIELILFSRHDNNISLNPNFTYVTSNISTHFIMPNVLLFSLFISQNKSFKEKFKALILGTLLVNLFFIIKFIISIINNELKEIVIDSKGKMINQIDGNDIWFKLIDLLNNLFNKYGSIGLRPLIVLLIWLYVSYKSEEIKSFFFKNKI